MFRRGSTAGRMSVHGGVIQGYFVQRAAALNVSAINFNQLPNANTTNHSYGRIKANITVNGQQKNAVVKHYMAVCSDHGGNYKLQFPVRHPTDPHSPNPQPHPRKWAIDPFGGNATQSNPSKPFDQTVTPTLTKEYSEEARQQLPQHQIIDCEIFAESWGVGTISLVETHSQLPGSTKHPLGNSADEKEMFGTVTIALSNGLSRQQIKTLLTTERDQLYAAEGLSQANLPPAFPPNNNQVVDELIDMVVAYAQNI